MPMPYVFASNARGDRPPANSSRIIVNHLAIVYSVPVRASHPRRRQPRLNASRRHYKPPSIGAAAFLKVPVGGSRIFLPQDALDHTDILTVAVKNRCRHMTDRVKPELSDFCFFTKPFHEVTTDQIALGVPVLHGRSLVDTKMYSESFTGRSSHHLSSVFRSSVVIGIQSSSRLLPNPFLIHTRMRFLEKSTSAHLRLNTSLLLTAR